MPVWNFSETFAQSVDAVRDDPASCVLLVRDWVEAFLEQRPESQPDDDEYADEIVAILMGGEVLEDSVVDGLVTRDLSGLVGSHAVTAGGRYHLNYNRFMLKNP